ncbi:AAA domain-containing protein [Bradyrhizobium sp. SZCCHNR2028]|uniref:AAA domain-containing protein n=1 Tax=Bradyrhizobium sp. SZCCHNR2028 TaxID=3057382 RepID=UPI0028E6A347|nr:AAA domain-containing protein [Bradyrhizobium sp. SZCCHNR2028]
MFDQTIRQLLSLFPRGATDNQLIWRLSASGMRLSASELLSSLGDLAHRGEIIRDSQGRWQVPRPRTGGKNGAPVREPGAAGDAAEALFAVDTTCSPLRRPPDDLALPPSDGTGSLPDWQSLLGYYAATQRRDPRGKIETFADLHGAAWQLLQLSGRWWAEASIRVSTERLPGPLVQALSKRNLSSPAIGWPVSVFPSPQGPKFVPALILPVDFRIEGRDVVLDIDDARPALNSAWVREVCRVTRWKLQDVPEQLFVEGEDNTIDGISGRLRHSFATIGGMTLRPAELASFISIKGTGLRNAAALFLPEDGSFTRAVAEDLEQICSWPAERLANTALAAVLSEAVIPATPQDSIDVLPFGENRALTDHQLEAADAALQRGLTVIQGPPGSGKSEVIFTLLLSAVLAGKSVLFSARNHQAIDEVEHRLKAVILDHPLLTRARDAEGERDVSFLDALNGLAHADTTTEAKHRELDETAGSLLIRAAELHDRRRKRREEIDAHLLLSELIERRDLLRKPGEPSVANGRPVGLLTRLRALLRRWLKGADAVSRPLPDNASLRQINRRIADLRLHVQELRGAFGSLEPDDAEHSGLARDLKALLPTIADHLTRPTADERARISERTRELDFTNVKSAKRMSADDAQMVLRRRPIWAVSTLSVPSRVPLVPGLFDYVIFDETSQSDIASAIPLLARARRGVIVGDPMQLNFVRPLGTGTEHALMDAARLPKEGRWRYAQSVNSLFDFCSTRPATKRCLLADQFRSAPAIVDYLNADFYGGQLIGRRWNEQFHPPKDYRPGLAWVDVTGSETRPDGRPVNKAEAEQIARLLKTFAEESGFEGSVGVISPFNAQVEEIQRAVRSVLREPDRDRLALRISTIDKFQGGEADIILLSLVMAANSQPSTRTFLHSERRRLNVAVSRARALCIVVGDLAHATTSTIPHIRFLASRASRPWSPPRPKQFDSSWERRLHTAMTARGLEPYPQYQLGTRYLDFALFRGQIRLDVEVDGVRWHTDASGNRKTADRLRDIEVMSRGFKVLRFWVHQLADDMEGCLDHIERELGR